MLLSISIIVPVYSGEAFLARLIEEISRLRTSWEDMAAPLRIEEVILVDDAAIDQSPGIVDELAGRFPWVTPLHLSRNFGQHPATVAGILHSAGDWIVTLDEDLQHPPGNISDLLEAAVRNQADLVYGKPIGAVHKNLFRDASSALSKAAIDFLSGNSAISKASSFRLIRGPIARGAASVCGHDTYLDVALSWYTQRIVTLQLDLKDERFIRTGRSGYSFRSLISHGRRLIFSSQLKALRLAIVLGVGAVVASLIGATWVLLQNLIFPEHIQIQGWSSLFLAVCFFGGISVFLLGVTLEYLTVLVMRAHGRPLFFSIDRSSDDLLRAHFGSPN